MQRVMEAFLTQDALAVVISLLTEPLSNRGSLSEDEAQLVQLIITFLRNLLKIPDRNQTAGPLPYLPVMSQDYGSRSQTDECARASLQ